MMGDGNPHHKLPTLKPNNGKLEEYTIPAPLKLEPRFTV